MNKTKIITISEEAAKLLRENPTWTYKKAIDKAKEMISNEKVSNEETKTMEKAN
ncbi:hypothetical protein [Tissierella praeacuta]|uniref:hypothetical protein n=1 Tax=Tissierella praeacuta TaxID=43131 RepID=UPI0028A58646|nr:hypothetical protein [Tissierella praeacuta]